MGTSEPVDRSDLLPGTLNLLILKTVARRGPIHGFGIAQFLADTSDGILGVEEGSLYPALQRLLAEGWVTGVWRQTENNRRARYYALTSDGRRELRDQTRRFETLTRAMALVLRPS